MPGLGRPVLPPMPKSRQPDRAMPTVDPDIHTGLRAVGHRQARGLVSCGDAALLGSWPLAQHESRAIAGRRPTHQHVTGRKHQV